MADLRTSKKIDKGSMLKPTQVDPFGLLSQLGDFLVKGPGIVADGIGSLFRSNEVSDPTLAAKTLLAQIKDGEVDINSLSVKQDRKMRSLLLADMVEGQGIPLEEARSMLSKDIIDAGVKYRKK